MNVDLDQWRVAGRFEAVDFAGLDDKNVAGPPLEGLFVDRPSALAFADELDFIVRMAMRTRPRARFPVVKKHGNGGAPLLNSDKLMGAADKRKIFLSHAMHFHLSCPIG